MMIRRASLLMPCRRLEDFPTHLTGQAAAELLAAWTALWHPSLIEATGRLPGWHSADDPPDPSQLEGELVIVPSVSRQRLASDWCDRLRERGSQNPPPVEAAAFRHETIAAAMDAASIASTQLTGNVVADFLALGYAHLQVELLTRAMHYSPVLDDEQFGRAVVAGARAAVAGDDSLAHEELARAFDLLADARNHVYAVDFYVVDVTLLAPSTLGDSLRAKLNGSSHTSLLCNQELIEQMFREHPATLAELRRAIEAGTACIAGGRFNGDSSGWESPESLLAEFSNFQEAAERHLGRQCNVFGQFSSSFSLLMPEIAAGTGFKAALHVAFDGGRLPRAEQCKTRWGQKDGPWIESLSATPLDAARPETWLSFAERVGDSIAHDFVATVVLAGWPVQGCEYHEDLRRAAGYNSVLGKLVTLEEYFRITRETDDWSSFLPTEYPLPIRADVTSNTSSSPEWAFRREAIEAHQQLSAGVVSIAPKLQGAGPDARAAQDVVINPWNFATSQYVDLDPLEFSADEEPAHARDPRPNPLPKGEGTVTMLPEVPGCGYAVREPGSLSAVPLVEGHTLRNETLELTVSAITGGIQSLRTHRDRGTRVSQRLVFQKPGASRKHSPPDTAGGAMLNTQMIADSVEIVRSDAAVGEITSRGRLLDAAGELLARFTQTARVLRGLPAAIIDIRLECLQSPVGDRWSSYIASRLAWSDESVSFRRGVQWTARETTSQRIESPEWVEASSGAENVVCLGMGVPFHRRAAPTWLDTLLVTSGEDRRQFQLALALDCAYPTQLALALATAGRPAFAKLPGPLAEPRGWFLHVSAKNVVLTRCEPPSGERAGIRLRILETEGRSAVATITAYRPFRTARMTDFRANAKAVLSIDDGQVSVEIGPHRWVQLEAEW
jgi:alpha-mannosidase